MTLIAVTCAPALLAPVVASAAISNPSAASVLKATKAAILKESGVHIVVSSKNGSTTSTVTVDIGTKYGTETISSGTESVAITVTPKHAYLQGSPTGLATIMGLSTTQVKKIGSHVMVMDAGTAAYTSLDSNLTTSVLPNMLPKLAGTTFKVGGGSKSNDYQLTWTTKATSTTLATTSVITISSGSKPLPVTETITSSTGSGKTTFSKWGEAVKASVPSGTTVTYKQVFG